MAQVFADDDQVACPVMPSFGSAMTPGKGVRRIRCAGCSHDTLPRNVDGAPLCPRCSDLLATAGAEVHLFPTSTIFRTSRWFRRRPSLS